MDEYGGWWTQGSGDGNYEKNVDFEGRGWGDGCDGAFGRGYGDGEGDGDGVGDGYGGGEESGYMFGVEGGNGVGHNPQDHRYKGL